MKLVKKIVSVVCILGLSAVAAHAADGDPDLTAVTGGITSIKTAVLGVAAATVAAGVALCAVKFGGKWVMGLFKTFTK